MIIDNEEDGVNVGVNAYQIFDSSSVTVGMGIMFFGFFSFFFLFDVFLLFSFYFCFLWYPLLLVTLNGWLECFVC